MENHSEAEIQEGGSRFTCGICFEPVDSNKRFEYNTKGCSSDTYCVNCVGKYIEAMVEEYNMACIKCPGLDCKESLDPISCRSIITPRVFDLWCNALSESLIVKEGVYRSYCPNPDCSTPYFSDCKDISLVTCSKCKGLFCFKCKSQWAPNHECLKYIERGAVDETAFRRLLVKKKWRRCPRCGYVVEKYTGCSIVKCRCGTIFCYKSSEVVYNHQCRCSKCEARSCLSMFCLCIVCLLFLLLVTGLVIIFSPHR